MIIVQERGPLGDFPGGPVAKTLEIPMQEAWVQSLAGELYPTYTKINK